MQFIIYYGDLFEKMNKEEIKFSDLLKEDKRNVILIATGTIIILLSLIVGIIYLIYSLIF